MDFPQPLTEAIPPSQSPIQSQPRVSFRRFFVIGLISALTVSALIAIAIFAVGKFGLIEFKILGTTGSVAGFSLIGLCCSLVAERPNFKVFATIGIVLAALSLLFIEILIWGEVSSNAFFDLTSSVNIIAIAMAHASLLLLAFGPRPPLNIVITATCVIIGVLAAMLLYVVFSDDFPGEGFFRILGSVAILDALGTVVTPLLKKVIKVV
ncbi:MAG: hypothetical protein HY975_03325 [Candidatus Kerfeldbacteria bacterium]|nr:hypothetical protein [Candidatus Kerfeldbacteria bacterium]